LRLIVISPLPSPIGGCVVVAVSFPVALAVRAPNGIIAATNGIVVIVVVVIAALAID